MQTGSSSLHLAKKITAILLCFVVLFSSGLAFFVIGTPVRSVSSLPATCNPGGGAGGTAADHIDLWNGSVNVSYYCSATNVWTAVQQQTTAIIHSSGVNAGSSLAQLMALCPASPCEVWLDPTTTVMSVGGAAESYPVLIGTSTQHQTVRNFGVQLSCNDNNAGLDCIDVGQYGAIVCDNKGAGVGSGVKGCAVTTNSTAQFNCLLCNAVKTGAQTDIVLQGLDINATTGASILYGLMSLVAIEGKGHISDLSFLGLANTVNIDLENGPATGDINNLTFVNIASYCGGVTGCLPLNIIAAGGSSEQGIGYYFFGLNIGDGLMNASAGTSTPTGCADGNGCLVNIDGGGQWNSGTYSTGNTTSLTNVVIVGLYIEGQTGQNTASHYISLNNAQGIEIIGLNINAGNSVTNCVLLTGHSASSVGRTHLVGHNSSGHCTNLVTNTATSFSGGGLDFDYTYPGNNGTVGVMVDGLHTNSLFASTTKCSANGTAASPSVASCGKAPAGVFSCDDSTNGVCQVNTTAMITANSTVLITEDDSTLTGTLLGITCDATPSVINPSVITAKVAGTSFTFKTTAATANPKCYQYYIIN